MKNKLRHFGGLILFYAVIVFGVLLLNARFYYLNNNAMETNIIAMNE